MYHLQPVKEELVLAGTAEVDVGPMDEEAD